MKIKLSLEDIKNMLDRRLQESIQGKVTDIRVSHSGGATKPNGIMVTIELEEKKNNNND